jgi:hypothetical protein
MGFELAVNGLSFSLNNVDLYKVAGFGTRYGSTNIIKTFNSGHSTRPGCSHTCTQYQGHGPYPQGGNLCPTGMYEKRLVMSGRFVYNGQW